MINPCAQYPASDVKSITGPQLGVSRALQVPAPQFCRRTLAAPRSPACRRVTYPPRSPTAGRSQLDTPMSSSLWLPPSR
jgi:hypothetical protein